MKGRWSLRTDQKSTSRSTRSTMTKKNPQCSPPDLETTTNLVWKGADVYSTAYGISVPSQKPGEPRKLRKTNQENIPATPEKSRNCPVIWEARRKLVLLGLTAVPVRGGSQPVPDILAWDQSTLYVIAVRRVRSQGHVHDIAIRHQELISDLKAMSIQKMARIQLWIRYSRRFHIYEILEGGLMSRGQV